MNISILKYALFGLPLGFVGLPLYVHLPKYYSDTMPVSLTVIGGIMFFTRIADCFADPFIGYFSDKFSEKRKLFFIISCLIISLGVIGLFISPAIFEGNFALVAISILLAITYFSYSFLNINFYSSGIALSSDYSKSAKVSALREGAIIIGVIIASSLPQILTKHASEQTAYLIFAFVFCVILFFSFFASKISELISVKTVKEEKIIWKEVFKDIELRWVFSVFFLNAIPPSITATLFLFYVSDILVKPEWSGLFLGIYFISAIIVMPLWTKMASKIGKRKTLIISMILAIASFIWAYGLEQNQTDQFFIICILSGAALGGDLTVLPSILTDVLNKKSSKGGVEFGIWNFISKFTLALAAGIALPALESLGYKPNTADLQQGRQALSFSYGLLPCIFKFLALTTLIISPIDKRRKI